MLNWAWKRFYTLGARLLLQKQSGLGLRYYHRSQICLSACTVELQWLEHRWLVYKGYFELVFESLGKYPIAADISIFWTIKGDFIFSILIMLCCAYSLELPRWGDSNGNTKYTIMLKKIKKKSLVCYLTYDKYSLARSSPVSNTKVFEPLKFYCI